MIIFRGLRLPFAMNCTPGQINLPLLVVIALYACAAHSPALEPETRRVPDPLLDEALRAAYDLPSRDSVYNLNPLVRDLSRYGKVFLNDSVPFATEGEKHQAIRYFETPDISIALQSSTPGRETQLRHRYVLPPAGIHAGLDRLVHKITQVRDWDVVARQRVVPLAIFFGATVDVGKLHDYIRYHDDQGNWINPFTRKPFANDTECYAFAADTGFAEGIRVAANQLGLVDHDSYEDIEGTYFERLICHSNGCVVAMKAILDSVIDVGHLYAMGSPWTDQHLHDRSRLPAITSYVIPGDPVVYSPTVVTSAEGDAIGLGYQFDGRADAIELPVLGSDRQGPVARHDLVTSYFHRIAALGDAHDFSSASRAASSVRESNGELRMTAGKMVLSVRAATKADRDRVLGSLFLALKDMSAQGDKAQFVHTVTSVALSAGSSVRISDLDESESPWQCSWWDALS